MAATDSAITRNATVVLAVIAAGAALHWMADILAPLALAVFLAVMIDGFARILDERVPWFPKPAAQPTAIIISLLVLAASVYIIADNAAGFVGQTQIYAQRLDLLVAKGAAAIHIPTPPSLSHGLNQALEQFDPSRYIGGAARVLGNLASGATFTFLVLIYLGFIIASRRLFRRKIVALFPHHTERDKAAHVFQRIRDGIESYLWIQTVTGLMIAVGSWAIMAVLGLENAFFWAFLIFVVSYIPIIGGAIGILLPPIFALVQFDSWWQAVVLIGVLQSINFVVGNIILPRMQGDSLNMDPVVVLLSLAFWGAIWGLPGAFLSTPLTVMAMVILAQFEGSRWIAVMLSGDGAPQSLSRHTPGQMFGHHDHAPPAGKTPKTAPARKPAAKKPAKPAQGEG